MDMFYFPSLVGAKMSLSQIISLNEQVDNMNSNNVSADNVKQLVIDGERRVCSIFENVWLGGTDQVPVYLPFHYRDTLVVFIKGTRVWDGPNEDVFAALNDVSISVKATFPKEEECTYLFKQGVADTIDWPQFPDVRNQNKSFQDVVTPVIAKRVLEHCGYVHWGYCYSAYRIITDTILPLFGKYLSPEGLVSTAGEKIESIKEIIFMGHSLGGAVSSMCSLLLHNGMPNNINVYSVALGPPRCVKSCITEKGYGYAVTLSNPRDLFQCSMVTYVMAGFASTIIMKDRIPDINKRRREARMNEINEFTVDPEALRTRSNDGEPVKMTFFGETGIMENRTIKFCGQEKLITTCRRFDPERDGARCTLHPWQALNNHRCVLYTNMFRRVEQKAICDLPAFFGSRYGRPTAIEDQEVIELIEDGVLKEVPVATFDAPMDLTLKNTPFRIISALDENMCIEVTSRLERNHSLVLGSTSSKFAKQAFYLSGEFIYVFNEPSQVVFDVYGGEDKIGKPLIVHKKNADGQDDNQKFRLIEADSVTGTFYIATQRDRVLTICGASKGTHIQTETRTGGKNQQWKLEINGVMWESDRGVSHVNNPSLEIADYILPPLFTMLTPEHTPFRIVSAADQTLCLEVEDNWWPYNDAVLLRKKKPHTRQAFCISPGYIHLFNQPALKVLDIHGKKDVAGRPVIVHARNSRATANQNFRLVPVEDQNYLMEPEQMFYIESPEHVLAIENNRIQENIPIVSTIKTGGINEKWKLEICDKIWTIPKDIIIREEARKRMCQNHN